MGASTGPPPPLRGRRVTPSGRLASGELRAAVADLLAADPGVPYTAIEVTNILEARSAGAVRQALEALADRGVIIRTGGRRYTPATGHAPTAASTTSAVSTTPAVSTGSPGSRGPVTRPNGQRYFPRTLAEDTDVAALRTLRREAIPVLLYGPPGTGKTALVEAAFNDPGDLVAVAGDGDTAVADFVGDYTQTADGRYEFVYGPLVEAMTGAKVLFIDDATLISPKVLAVVYPAMDGRRQITVRTHRGETITAADGFYVIAGHNPGVHGAVLTEALASRFSVRIHVSSDYDLAAALHVPPTRSRRPATSPPGNAKAKSGGRHNCGNCSPSNASPTSPHTSSADRSHRWRSAGNSNHWGSRRCPATSSTTRPPNPPPSTTPDGCGSPPP